MPSSSDNSRRRKREPNRPQPKSRRLETMSLKKHRSSQLMDESHFSSVVEPSTSSVEASSAHWQTSTEDTHAPSTQATTAQSNESAMHDLQDEPLNKDALIATLRDELSAMKAQEVAVIVCSAESRININANCLRIRPHLRQERRKLRLSNPPTQKRIQQSVLYSLS